MDKIKYSLQVLFIFIKSNIKILIPTSLMILLLPIIFLQTQKPKSLSSSASTLKSKRIPCGLIRTVEINPGNIITGVKQNQVNLSALAYDIKNKPIDGSVKYKWGISSNNGIGKLESKDNIASFFPKKIGKGNIYVYIEEKCRKKPVYKGIDVIVKK